MTNQRTHEHRPASLPVKRLAVEVVSGPDAHRRAVSAEKLSIGTAANNDLVLTDDTVSRYHVEISRIEGRISLRDLGSTNGTVVGSVRLGTAEVMPRTTLRLGRTEVQILDDAGTVALELSQADSFAGVLGGTATMRVLMRKAERVAQSDTSVLLLGETGTGKEMFARALHASSDRRDGPFETVDCGALHPSLIQSELFGHEPGAFTGASQRHVGAFQRADGGTLFLDEVGELSSQLQPALLGALERRAFRRVGGAETIRVNVRLIAATNRDLREAVNEGIFREDLYYRLGVVTLPIPPLRDRPGDIALLATHFARQAGHDGAIEDLTTPDDLDAMLQHHWPGNVRELKNHVEALLALGEAPTLRAQSEAPADGSQTGYSRLTLGELLEQPYKEARQRVLSEFERMYFEEQLRRADGNIAQVARTTKMNRTYLMDLLKRQGLR